MGAMGAGIMGGLRSLRPLLTAGLVMSVAAMVYFVALIFIAAAALSRLSVVHNSAAQHSESVYFGMPYVFSRRRGSVPGAAVPRRQKRFNKAFPQSCQTASAPRVQCAICMDSVRPGNLKRRLECGHEFHKVRFFFDGVPFPSASEGVFQIVCWVVVCGHKVDMFRDVAP